MGDSDKKESGIAKSRPKELKKAVERPHLLRSETRDAGKGRHRMGAALNCKRGHNVLRPNAQYCRSHQFINNCVERVWRVKVLTGASLRTLRGHGRKRKRARGGRNINPRAYDGER